MKKVSTLVLTVLAAALLFALPTVASDIGGPSVVMLDSLVKKYEPVRFDHSTHSAYFAGGCWDCHHQHVNYRSEPCSGCHNISNEEFKKSVTNTFFTCQSCHGAQDPMQPGMPGLKVAYHKQCFKCHRGMGNVGKSPAGCTEQCHARREQQ